MNQNKTFLDLNLRLLVAQHGKERVSEALSTIGDATVDTVRDGIATLDKGFKTAKTRRPGETRRKAPRKSVEQLICDANLSDPEAADIVEQLARAYENKEFLPALRDVKNFMARRSDLPTTLRSRADALPTVIGVLAQCEIDELRSLNRRRQAQGGDLGYIADQILGSYHMSGK